MRRVRRKTAPAAGSVAAAAVVASAAAAAVAVADTVAAAVATAIAAIVVTQTYVSTKCIFEGRSSSGSFVLFVYCPKAAFFRLHSGRSEDPAGSRPAHCNECPIGFFAA